MAFVPNERWSFSSHGRTGRIGQPTTLTWSIVPDGTTIPGQGASDLIALFDAKIGAGQSDSDLSQRPWFEPLQASFDRWSELGGIEFLYEPFDDGLAHGQHPGQQGVRGDIRLSAVSIDGTNNTLAYSYYPDNSDIVLDSDDAPFLTNPASNYIQLRNVLMHEVGHGLGFEHVSSSDATFLMEPSINISFDGPQLDDIRGLHHLYGDALEKTSAGLGNNTLTGATRLGELTDTIAIGADAAPDLVVAPAETDFVSIANTSDRDFYAFTIAEPSTVNLVLTPRGGMFHQALPGETQTLFNTSASNNLSLALFGPTDADLLASANSAPAGDPESITNLQLTSPGEYFVRVMGSNQVVQLYQLDLTLVAPIAVLPGDYNLDGVVDAADYSTWRDTLGSTGTGLSADGNGDNLVDQLDYQLWKANFGRIATSATSHVATNVPEPSTLLFLSTAIMGAFASRWMWYTACRESRRTATA